MKSNGKQSGPKYPDAPAKGLADFKKFVNHPSWKPETIDIPLLKNLDIGSSNESRVITALRFLHIIDGQGHPTPEFTALKSDYRNTLNRLVRQGYAKLLEQIPLELLSQKRIVKFFGGSNQTSTRQVKLFVWLCEEAGIVLPDAQKLDGTS